MEASIVLKEYLELFTADCRQIKLIVAPNAVVEWFGRTVRGPAKIHDFLRFEVATQYEHANFDKAEECQPIEERPSHWKTKSLPAEDADFVLPINKVTGITTLKTYVDSDIEDDDLGMLPLPRGNCTPEPHSNSTAHISELTPPSSTIKFEDINASDSESDLEDTECASAPKRSKRSIPTPFSYLRRMPASTSKITHVSKRQLIPNQFDIQMGDDTSSDEELHVDLRKILANEYTPLKYVETIGKLVAKPQILTTTDSPPTPRSTRDWDRPVRLRISYRRNLLDKSLQIALIIYEHLQNTSADGNQDAPSTLGMRRRNLLPQFNDPALSEPPHATPQVGQAMESIAVTEVGTAVPLTDVDEESTAISVVQLRTPTRNDRTPPATPKRRPRVPYSLSGTKRTSPSSSTTTPKRNASRSLRL